ncbi:hypothetical protein [Tsuneonella sp. HG222]
MAARHKHGGRPTTTRRWATRGAILACGALAAAVPASAKDDGVTTIAEAVAELKKRSANQPPVEVRRRTAQLIGECIAKGSRERPKVLKFLHNGVEEDGRKLVDRNCLGGAMLQGGINPGKVIAYPPAAMRAMVADGLVRVVYDKSGPTDFLSVPRLDYSEFKDIPLENTTATARRVVAELGECTARISPEEVRKLALTKAASPEEMTQIRALVPTFAQCLPPNVQLAFPPDVLRDASVLAYARLAFANEGQDRR